MTPPGSPGPEPAKPRRAPPPAQEASGSARGACDTGALPFRGRAKCVGQLVRTIRVLTIRLSVEIGGTTIVEAVTTQVGPGEKIGLVGRNGVGKTTLLRLSLAASPRPAPALCGAAGRGVPLAGSADRRGARRHELPRPRPRGPGSRPAPGRPRESPGRGRRAPVTGERRALHRAPGNASRPCWRLRRCGGVGGSAGSPWASGSPTTASMSTLRALSGGERRRLELVRILFAGSELLLLD